MSGKGSPMGHLQALTSALMHHVMRTNREQALPNFQILPRAPSARKPLLALTDGSSTLGSHEDFDGGSPGSAPSAVGDASPGLTFPILGGNAPGGVPPVVGASAVGAAIAAVQAAIEGKAAKAKAKAQSKHAPSHKRPAAATEEAVGKAAAKPIAKRPAAATDEALGTCTKPNVSDIKCRSCVTARTGLPGLGMTRSVRYEGDPTDARQEAVEWLRTRCEELGVDCDY